MVETIIERNLVVRFGRTIFPPQETLANLEVAEPMKRLSHGQIVGRGEFLPR
jgi:hypothetical protein